VGDQGQMLGDGIVFSVEDTQKIQADVFGHHGHVLQGNLRVGDRMNASVRQDLRCQAALNHSVTHLLHAALRAELGDHVAQRGSLVDAQRTRFDFSHGEPLTLAQMQAVESRVNAQIRANVPVQVATMSYDQAIQQGATALFGEKYGAEVRVVGMGPFSTELCGGTHVSRTGDIGLFRLVTQSGVAAGIRRVEGITGADAMALMQHEQSQLLTLAGMFHVQARDLVSRLQQVPDLVGYSGIDIPRLHEKD
jgi:alanyl-tRNA synthetase